MASLFDRRVDLVVGETRVTGLRAAFTVTKTLAKTPNSLDLKVWNLSPRTRGALQPKGTKVILVAGYGEEVAQVFAGDSRMVDHDTQKADTVTRIQCGDGEKAYSEVRASESFAPGTPVADVLAHLIRKLGVNEGNALTRIRQGGFRGGFQQFAHGYVVTGRASDELDRLLKSCGLTWSIQDGALQVLAEAEAGMEEIIRLSSSSGLIGSPVHGSPPKEGKPPTLKVRSLLRGAFRPGRRVQIDSRHVSGVFKISSVQHTGDTAGGEWYSDLEVHAV